MTFVEKAVAHDIDTLIDFQQKLAFETEGVKLDSEELRKGIMTLLDDPTRGVYYVVRDGSSIVGCHLITYEWSDWRNGTILWLQSVYVRDSHRRKGIFKLMYDHLVTTIMYDDKLKGLRLYVDKSNERAIDVYRSIGMNGEHYTVFEWMKENP